jgi:site-specific recombinase XerD
MREDDFQAGDLSPPRTARDHAFIRLLYNCHNGGLLVCELVTLRRRNLVVEGVASVTGKGGKASCGSPGDLGRAAGPIWRPS